jgi:hypothetical protein
LAAITDPQERLRAGLSGLFAFYRETERMTGRALRDLPDLPVMADVLQPLFALIGQIHQTLLAPWRVAPGRETLVTAAIGHALSFWTWHSLVREQGLTEAEAVEALVTLVRALTEGE